jgi:ketosteroid isomerase-like protein
VEKKVRLARAQAEIDRILEVDREMKKVVHVAPPSPGTLVEHELDEKESRLEADLYEAVKQQEYAKAASLKLEISQMHVDDGGSVLRANSLFYRAFSEKSLEDMEGLWLKDSTSTCIHPSCKPMVGYRSVCEGWKRMFESSGDFQRTFLEPHNIRIAVKGATMALVSCDEHVYLRRFVRGQKRTTDLVNMLTATNVFRKVAGRWYLFHHHSSWHPDSEVSKLALRRRQSPSLQGAGPQRGDRRLAGASGGSNQGANQGAPTIGMDGILGMADHGPWLGTSGKKKQQGDKPVKRIVMGSISDIFNGQLGDIFGTGSDSGGAAGGSRDGLGGDVFDGTQDGAILRFGRISNDDKDDEADDDEGAGAHFEIINEDDSEEEDDEDEEAEDESEAVPQSVSIIKEWAKKSSSSAARKGGQAASVAKASGGGKLNRVSGAPKDELRQSCISALRRLCDRGSISHRQKRVLLTDIIACSARGEFSMVEVAFELLCGEATSTSTVATTISSASSGSGGAAAADEGDGDAFDVAEEEFADQCRVFATSLMDPPPQ